MIFTVASNSIEMAAPSAFSYAQAAKGQNPLPSATTSANQTAQPQASEPASSTTKSSTTIEDAFRPESTRTGESAAPAAERQEIDSNLGSESDLRSDATAEKRSETKRDDDAGRLDRPWRRADKSTRSSSTATRSVDEQDSRKSRKNKKTKASDKQPGDQAAETEKEQEPVPETPKIELSEAPIPSVNIWHQRKEAHLAKAKPTTAAAEVITNGESAPVVGEDTKKAVKPSAETSPARDAAPVATTNGTKPPRKATDASTRPERNGSRGSRVAEKDAKESKTELPPPVDDSSSWPTPETAVKEEKKKPVTASVDRQEKEVKDAQEDASQAKPRQKEKWVAYEYVPSVNFETQIPQMRNSKPRGGARGTNSTRSPAGANVADKTATAASTTKSGESRDRARESGGASTRAASVPPAAKRMSMDSSNAKDQKKAPGHSPGEKTKDVASAHQSVRTPLICIYQLPVEVCRAFIRFFIPHPLP